MTFAEKLQRLRKEKGMSQEQLAAALMVSRQAISKWETGESLPDAGKLVQLSRLFTVSVDVLLKEELALIREEKTEKDESERLRREETPEPAAEKPKYTALLVLGTVLSAVGALGFTVIWVLSTMIETWAASATTSADGVTTYTCGGGYSFAGFVDFYRLEAVCVVLGVLLATGILLLVWRWYRRRGGDFPKGI
ncbi:MAG: helix-turn-helix domain-containing protein [Ruminococcus bromii]|nr:helix-turn-helix domain-containing protein [Ruminococcus bromii]